jgi:hypothetical protein
MGMKRNFGVDLVRFHLEESTKYPAHDILIKKWAAKEYEHLTLCKVELVDYSDKSYLITFKSPNQKVEDKSFFVAKSNCYIVKNTTEGKKATLEIF